MRKAGFVVLFLCSIGTAYADQIATLGDGRQVLLKDDGTYQIQPSAPKEHETASYADLKLVDLKVDIKELEGQRIRTLGKGMYVGDMFMLTDPATAFDMNGIAVDISKVPREMRKWIVTNCATGCRATVEGEVRSDIHGFMPGIMADTVRGR